MVALQPIRDNKPLLFNEVSNFLRQQPELPDALRFSKLRKLLTGAPGCPDVCIATYCF
jgi:hypothetical protein